MKLIKPSVELLQQPSGIEGVFKQIERVGRTCYKSEDKITEDSAKPFVDRMINSKHYAMLEHGTIYLMFKSENAFADFDLVRYHENPYSVLNTDWNGGYYVTTNLRVIVENHWEDDLQYICEPTEHHIKRISLKFNTNIGVSREGNRHRSFSIAEQSTRYCNYTKDKFGSEITFVIPAWIEDIDCLKGLGYSPLPEEAIDWSTDSLLAGAFKTSEFIYKGLIEQGYKPQQAREVLPLATATEVVYTGFEDDWKHFFDLRYRGTTGAPHPNMLQVATMAHDVIQKELGLDL